MYMDDGDTEATEYDVEDFDLGDAEFDLYGDGADADAALAMMVGGWDDEYDALNHAEEIEGAAYSTLTRTYSSTIGMFATALLPTSCTRPNSSGEGMAASGTVGAASEMADVHSDDDDCTQDIDRTCHLDTPPLGLALDDTDYDSSAEIEYFHDEHSRRDSEASTTDWDVGPEFDLYGDGADAALALMAGDWDDEYDAMVIAEEREGDAYPMLTRTYPSTISMFASPLVESDGGGGSADVPIGKPDALDTDGGPGYYDESDGGGIDAGTPVHIAAGKQQYPDDGLSMELAGNSDTDTDGEDYSDVPTDVVLSLVAESLAEFCHDASASKEGALVAGPNKLGRNPHTSLSCPSGVL